MDEVDAFSLRSRSNSARSHREVSSCWHRARPLRRRGGTRDGRWPRPGGYRRRYDDVLDNVTHYWLTNTAIEQWSRPVDEDL
jgi:hypothetical protein